MSLSTEQQILIDVRMARLDKKRDMAFLLLFLFGWLGGHRFYLGKPLTGLVMLLWLPLNGLLVSPLFSMLFDVHIGLIAIWALILWVIADAFFVPRMVRSYNSELRSRLESELTGQT